MYVQVNVTVGNETKPKILPCTNDIFKGHPSVNALAVTSKLLAGGGVRNVSNLCDTSRIANLLADIGSGSRVFAAINFWLLWIFLTACIVGVVVSSWLGYRERMARRVEIEDDQEGLLDDGSAPPPIPPPPYAAGDHQQDQDEARPPPFNPFHDE
jgi:hypothetical protein